jgi:hypothetical protein
MDPLTAIGALGSLVSVIGGLWAFVQWLRRRGRTASSSPPTPSPDRPFNRADFQLVSTMYRPTRFPIDLAHAGHEGRAIAGSIAVGSSLAVLLQDQSVTDEAVEVWLTIENRGAETVRWFGPKVTCYPDYVDVSPDAAGDPPAHHITDLYPGEQVTAYYRFTMQPPQARMPKFMVCSSWDDGISFWWSRGA